MSGTGIFGKLPAHGDFVRRDLPLAFTEPWDAWLSSCLARLQAQDREAWAAQWAAFPGWCFHLPAGVAGNTALAGVLLPSQDSVGRRFPLTIARLLDARDAAPPQHWYARLLACGRAARDQGASIATLLDDVADVDRGIGQPPERTAAPPHGWRTADGVMIARPVLMPVEVFCRLLATASSPTSSAGAGRLASTPATPPPPQHWQAADPEEERALALDSDDPTQQLPMATLVQQAAHHMQDVLAAQVASAQRLLTPAPTAPRAGTDAPAASSATASPVAAGTPAASTAAATVSTAAIITRTPAAPGRWHAEAASHPGTVRSYNEDRFLDRSALGLWVVADGVGGQRDGHTASSAIVAALAALPEPLSAGQLLAEVRQAMTAVHGALQPGPQNPPNSPPAPASTVVALLGGGMHFACLWAGDSRIYLFRDGHLVQITRDHSLVQELVDAGLLAAENAEAHPDANVITRAVGAPQALDLDKVHGNAMPGDLFLLCTDGLFKALPEPRMAELLAGGGRAEALLDAALVAGARDNVTVVTVSVPEPVGTTAGSDPPNRAAPA